MKRFAVEHARRAYEEVNGVLPDRNVWAEIAEGYERCPAMYDSRIAYAMQAPVQTLKRAAA